MNLRSLWIPLTVFLVLACLAAYWLWPKTETTAGSADALISHAKDDPKPKTQSPPAPPPKPATAIDGADTALIGKARQVLNTTTGEARVKVWQELLDQADYFELVRMTEIPAQPKLDGERSQLRYLAIQRLGKIGRLTDFIAQRLIYDKKQVSYVQADAWREYARTEPKAAAELYRNRITTNPPEPFHAQGLLVALAKGFAAAPAAEATDAVASLPEELQAPLRAELVKWITPPAPNPATIPVR
jgi:hypothetical protein